MADPANKSQEKIKLIEINSHLTCYLCKGYYIDATTISECLHSFCRSCIIKFLHENSYCPICEVIINKAKPNLKLDKTLQDIVYKLVPELFYNEMKRRQRFYRDHPDLATKVTPEERGEDTERTIFNPSDTISLSIEYISDDSTPGAILIPHLNDKGSNNNKTNADNDENSAIKRFLQCSGMCRVEVLKKFIGNKYNVDTSQYYIDILYKRVPLPDHYTLIDIAYIYSWKRNEPLKFFFKITDITLVNDNFDYLIQPQIKHDLKQDKSLKNCTAEKKPPHKSPRTKNQNQKSPNSLKLKEKEHKIDDNFDYLVQRQIKQDKSLQDCTTEKKPPTKSPGTKNQNQKYPNPPNTKEKEHKIDQYPNITLDNSDDGDIIKIEKVSNKNGLQIGIKITKQISKRKPATPKPENPKNFSDIETEKSKFLKSIELTAKNNVTHTSSVNNNVSNTSSPPKCSDSNTPSPKKELTPKRKTPVSAKGERCRKSKKLGNPKAPAAAAQLVSNIKQDAAPKITKLLDQIKPNSNLQALLYDSYKINIPSSLSVTVKNQADEPTPSPFQKPVQNYIEILKIPDTSAPTISVDTNSPILTKTKEETSEAVKLKFDTTAVANIDNIEPSKQETESTSKSPPKTPTRLPSPPYLPCKVTNMPLRETFAKLNPRTPQTFQKMFEEAIKNPDFNAKFQTLAVTKTDLPSASPPSPKATEKTPPAETPTTAKRKILEIASKLYKKTKMEQEKSTATKLSRPSYTKKVKSNPPLKDFNSYISSKPAQTTSLHSPSLGLNYTVSVSQPAPSSNPDSKVESSSTPSGSAKISQPPQPTSPKLSNASPVPSSAKKKTSPGPIVPKTNLNVVTSTQSENNQPLSPNSLLEKYKIQNLAQLSANFNFPSNICMNSSASQLAAIHQAMIYKHFEMQNRQNWLNMNSGPLMQYEKYLKSLSKS